MTEGVYFYTYVPYFIRKRSIMQVFSLFFQDDAGQRGGFGPVGKITHQNGKTFERKCPEIFQHRLLFIRADDLPAVEDGAHHAAGAHGFQSRLQAGMLLCAVENTAWSAPGSQPKLNITASAVPGCTTCKRSAWLWQCSSYRAAGTPSCSRCFRVDAMAASCTSKRLPFLPAR